MIFVENHNIVAVRKFKMLFLLVSKLTNNFYKHLKKFKTITMDTYNKF